MCASIFLHIFMYIRILMCLCIHKYSTNLSSYHLKYSQNLNLILSIGFFKKREITQNYKAFFVCMVENVSLSSVLLWNIYIKY